MFLSLAFLVVLLEYFKLLAFNVRGAILGYLSFAYLKCRIIKVRYLACLLHILSLILDSVVVGEPGHGGTLINVAVFQ